MPQLGLPEGADYRAMRPYSGMPVGAVVITSFSARDVVGLRPFCVGAETVASNVGSYGVVDIDPDGRGLGGVSVRAVNPS